ncbi:MAG: acyl carrier protein [Eubacteriales bacterium]|nr:acyl carrier protein [Eubacteriales bacterium]MDY3332354.1 acyl carrier protein [Gallibacter sp.]
MVFEKVKNIIAEQLEVNIEDITLETNLMKDLDADSIDAVEIIVGIEEEYDIEITEEEADGFATVGDIVEYVEERING